MNPLIVTLTINPSIDKSAEAANVAPEHKLRCHSARLEPGGGGLNVSRAIKKLDGKSLALYARGGPPGQILQGLLEQEGISQISVETEDWTRESFAVFEAATGQQYRFNLPGPTLKQIEWEKFLSVLSSLNPKPDWIVASGSLPPGVPDDFYLRVAKVGQSQGARVIVDTSGDALRAMARAEIYLLKPNLRELCQLAGKPLDEEEEQESIARGLIESGHSQNVVVSLGAAGALLVTKDGCLRRRSPTTPIKSKIGAGDALVAGLTLGLARGWTVEESVSYGVAAGAAAVMTPGSELCRLEDTERLYRRLCKT